MIRITTLARTAKGKDKEKTFFEKREYTDPLAFLKESFLDKKLKTVDNPPPDSPLIIQGIPAKLWRASPDEAKIFATHMQGRIGVLIDG